MKPEAILVIGGKPKEFADIQEAAQFLKENNITDIQVVNLASPIYKPELPPNIEEFYDNTRYVPTFYPKSGQENRRARRAAERANKKK